MLLLCAVFALYLHRLMPKTHRHTHRNTASSPLNLSCPPPKKNQAHACAAMVNFAENCDQDVLKPYLDMLIGKLLALLQQSRKRNVQEGALTAMASVADCSQEYFEKYYDAVMPLLKEIMQVGVCWGERGGVGDTWGGGHSSTFGIT
jgi:hypothetical protein